MHKFECLFLLNVCLNEDSQPINLGANQIRGFIINVLLFFSFVITLQKCTDCVFSQNICHGKDSRSIDFDAKRIGGFKNVGNVSHNHYVS
jgi:hypothetical protein